MIFSVMLWMPSWGGMINGLLTLRGAWNKVAEDPILKFFVVAITFYGMSTFEGPLLSVKTVNALSHYTDWTVGHAHAGALGWNGFIAFGVLYWLAPRLFQTKGLYSKKLAELHFWVATVGILLYVVALYSAGVTQGLMWRAFDQTGRLLYPDFVETVLRLRPMYMVRAIGGSLYLVGAILGAWNIIMTWKMRPARYEEPVYEAAALVYDKETPDYSRLGDAHARHRHRRASPGEPGLAPGVGRPRPGLHPVGCGGGGLGLALRDHPHVPHQEQCAHHRLGEALHAA
jgi:cytochrome c oxidase cbb3-type subunit I/II